MEKSRKSIMREAPGGERMNVKDLTELLDAFRSKVEKQTAEICIILANQHENGKEIAKDIAEKFDIEVKE